MITPNSEKIQEYRTGTKPIKNHFGSLDICNGPMKNLKKGYDLTVPIFEFILNLMRAIIVKQPTKMISNPTEEHR